MKKKLRLNLDALAVESFTSERDGDGRGTVAGLDSEFNTEFNTCDTCYNSCGGTCKWQTCNAPWACA